MNAIDTCVQRDQSQKRKLFDAESKLRTGQSGKARLPDPAFPAPIGRHFDQSTVVFAPSRGLIQNDACEWDGIDSSGRSMSFMDFSWEGN
jgi:hypothetical protein